MGDSTIMEDMDVESGNVADTEDYRKMIERNLAERDAFLKSLQIDEDVESLRTINRQIGKKRGDAKKPLPKKKKTAPRNISKEVLPRREPSRRLRKLPAPGDKVIKAEVVEELLLEKNETDDRLLGSIKLEDPETEIFSNLNHEMDFNPNVDLKECSLQSFTDQIRCLRMMSNMRVVMKRIQSAYVHPTTSKCLSFIGEKDGILGIWDSSMDGESGVMTYNYHKKAINCISTRVNDSSKLFTTSHDGTFCCLDLQENKCENLFATDFDDRVKHLTWHDEIDDHTFLLAHGSGSVGTLDLRTPKVVQKWDDCFAKSCRTVQHRPGNSNQILASSGIGGCIIYDIRKNASEPLASLEHSKGLTSAFFSPDGSRVLTTCNDDKIRVFSVNSNSSTKLKVSVRHNNFTGRWLTVFRAKWFPWRSDVFHVGSLLLPRMIQVYNVDGDIIASLEDEDMTTIQSVQACHPTLPFVISANSGGRAHLFSPPDTLSKSS